MARAYVLELNQAEYDALAEKDKVTFVVSFTGAEVPNGYDVAYGELFLDPGDPVSQLRAKITPVIQLEASARGLVVAKQDMFIPGVQQGV